MKVTTQYSQRDFIKYLGIILCGFLLIIISLTCRRSQRLNILIITADDLNYNSVGVYGCKVPNTTPHIDRLASQGIRFTHAYVTAAVCTPSRGALVTGLYPHRSGIEGFNHIEDKHVDTIMDLLQKAGYLTGVLGKINDSTPKIDFHWDVMQTMASGLGRDSLLYYKVTKEFCRQAQKRNRPFFLMANLYDPHRPFFGSTEEERYLKMANAKTAPAPSYIYQPNEIKVPEFLPDLPEVRTEIAQYYCSVRRCDDAVGAVLKALRESGEEENTLVMFLSDHGMAFPFAKTNCYLNSTRTPWIVRWPGKIKSGTVDDRHFISSIDFMPTILDVVKLGPSRNCDGFSFMPLLFGNKQENREMVFTQIHETSALKRYPMRSIQDKKYGYIFNPWSDGNRVFMNESQRGLTFSAMRKAAKSDHVIASRFKLFRYRVVEEFYDYENDPDALNNLIDNPDYKDVINQMRQKLLEWMRKTEDPALYALENRDSPEALQKFMEEQQAKADQRPQQRRLGRGEEY